MFILKEKEKKAHNTARTKYNLDDEESKNNKDTLHYPFPPPLHHNKNVTHTHTHLNTRMYTLCLKAVSWSNQNPCRFFQTDFLGNLVQF